MVIDINKLAGAIEENLPQDLTTEEPISSQLSGIGNNLTAPQPSAEDSVPAEQPSRPIDINGLEPETNTADNMFDPSTGQPVNQVDPTTVSGESLVDGTPTADEPTNVEPAAVEATPPADTKQAPVEAWDTPEEIARQKALAEKKATAAPEKQAWETDPTYKSTDQMEAERQQREKEALVKKLGILPEHADDEGFWMDVYKKAYVVGDMGKGVVNGAAKFIDQMSDIVHKMGVPNYSVQVLDDDGKFDIKFLSPEETEAAKEARGYDGIIKPFELQTGAGRVTETLAKYAFAYMPVGRGLAALNVTSKLARIGVSSVGESIVTAAMADKNDVRLATLCNEVPVLGNIVPDWIADNNPENESYWESKAKWAIEGAMVGASFGVAGELISTVLTHVKSSKLAKVAADSTAPEAQAAKGELDAATQSQVDQALKEHYTETFASPYSIADEERNTISSIVDKHDLANPAVRAEVEKLGVNADEVIKRSPVEPAPVKTHENVSSVVESESVHEAEALKAMGVDPVEIERAGNLSDKAGLRNNEGVLLSESKAPVSGKGHIEMSVDNMILTKDTGESYINMARLNSDEDVAKLMGAYEKHIAEAGPIAKRGKVSNESVRMASQADLDTLSTILHAEVTRPFTAVEVHSANRLLMAFDNTVMRAANEYSNLGTKEAKAAYMKVRDVRTVVADRIMTGRTETGRSLQAWNIPVDNAAVMQTPKNPLQVIDADGNVIEGAKFVSSKGTEAKKMSSILAKDGSIKPGHKAVDVNGNEITGPVTGRVHPDDAVVAERAKELAHKQHIKRSVQITDITSGASGRSVETECAILSSIKAQNPENVSRTISGLEKFKNMAKGTSEGLYKVWINNLLFNPATHAMNIASNVISGGIHSPLVTFASEAELKLMGKGGDFRVAAAELKGIIEGHLDGWRLMTGKTKNELLMSTKFDTHQEVKMGWEGLTTFNQRFFKTVSDVTSFPGWALGKMDTFSKGVSYRAQINKEAAVQASLSGKMGAEYDALFNDLRNNPTKQMMTESAYNSKVATYTQDFVEGSLMSKIGDLQQSSMLAKIAMPFIRTPYNIIKFGAQLTPGLNLFVAADREAIAAGGRKAAAVYARMLMGTGVLTSAAIAANNGMISGYGPTDPKERRSLLATGWRPYSVKKGDTWYSYERFQPFNTPLGIGADVAYVLSHLDEEGAGKMATMALVATMRHLSGVALMSGPIATLGTIFSPDETNVAGLKKWGIDNAVTAVPFSGLAKPVAEFIDPTKYETKEDPEWGYFRSVYETTLAKIGLNRNAPVRYDAFGEKYSWTERAAGPAFIVPISTSTQKTDRVRILLANSKYPVTLPDRSIGGVPLTNAEYSRYSQLAGQEFYTQLKELTDTGYYDNGYIGKDSDFQVQVAKAQRSSRKLAAKQLALEFPSFEQRAVEVQQEKDANLLKSLNTNGFQR